MSSAIQVSSSSSGVGISGLVDDGDEIEEQLLASSRVDEQRRDVEKSNARVDQLWKVCMFACSFLRKLLTCSFVFLQTDRIPEC